MAEPATLQLGVVICLTVFVWLLGFAAVMMYLMRRPPMKPKHALRQKHRPF